MAILPLLKGSAPTLLEAKKGNELITAINSLANMSVEPADFGSFKFADGKSVIDLSKLAQTIGGGIQLLDDTGVLQPLQVIINNIFNRLNNPSISAVCNPDGTITVTLTI